MVFEFNVTPYWPSANGEAERFNRTIGKAIQCYHAEWKDWRNHIQEFLLQCCTTPYTITGVAPTDILFQYRIPNGIPTIKKFKLTKQGKTINSRDALVKAKIKEKTDISRNARYNPIKEGDDVLDKNIRCNNKLQSIWENEVFKLYPSSVKITNKEKTVVRHKVHIKKYKGNIPAIQITSRPTQQAKLQLSATPYITLLLEPDYPQTDNHNAESDTDLSFDTSDTEPYAGTESKWMPVVVACKRNRKKPTWLNDFDTS